MLSCLQHAWRAIIPNNLLQYASRSEVLARVQQDGMTLQYLSEAMRSDKEVVIAAVCESGLALQYA